jgi:hypothetical protein
MKGHCRDDLRHWYLSKSALLPSTYLLSAIDCMADALLHCRFDDVALLKGFAL